jgi:hypothetical protein
MSILKTVRTLRSVFRRFDRRVTLMFFVLRRLHKPPAEVFCGAWKIVDGVSAKRLPKDRYGVPLKHVRHFRLRHAIKRIFPQYSPAVIADREMLELIKEAPAIIASIHARTEFAMCAALDRAGQQSAIVTAYPIQPAEMNIYSLSTSPQNILRQPDVFIQARAALKSGKIIICDVDFIADKDLPSTRICISTSLFEFARTVKSNLFFGYTQISPNGAMNCIFKAAPRSTSAQEDAQNFIAFLESVQNELTNLTVEDWTRPREAMWQAGQ